MFKVMKLYRSSIFLKMQKLASSKDTIPSTLPVTFTRKGKEFVFMDCPRSRFPEVAEIYEESGVADNTGIGADEHPTRQDVMKLLETAKRVFIALHEDRIAVFTLANDSPITRSSKPTSVAGYEVSNKKHRFGIGAETLALSYQQVARMGYRAFLGRVSTPSRGQNITIERQRHNCLGVIPESNNINGRLVNDFIVYGDFGLHAAEKYNEEPSFPTLDESIPLKPYDDVVFANRQLPTKTGNFLFRPGMQSDHLIVEKLLRKAAMNGQGFALDEFTKSGHFNRKLFQKCHLAVAEDQSEGRIIAAVLFGLTGLCRSPDAKSSNLYFVTDEKVDRKEICSALLKEIQPVLLDLGFNRITTDVFVNKQSDLQLFHEHGFLLTGSIPNCAFVKGVGPCLSAVLTKRIDNFVVFPNHKI